MKTKRCEVCGQVWNEDGTVAVMAKVWCDGCMEKMKELHAGDGFFEAEGVWWCNSHKRQATHTDAHGRRCCDPALGGILLPCNVVFAPMSIEQA